ncbi:hypothetical protein A8B82_07570 [Sulfitobacter sp. EhC04]|nr:hypothetical protein A8B82_07570 [Sulfitobacter sp. EhC04]
MGLLFGITYDSEVLDCHKAPVTAGASPHLGPAMRGLGTDLSILRKNPALAPRTGRPMSL